MSASYELNAELRTDAGKGASRRLRHAGKVPGIIYGGNEEPVAIQVEHDKLFHAVDNEAFFSHLLTINIDGAESEEAIMKDLQRHPFKPTLLHFDLQRVVRGQKMQMTVPLHFLGDEDAPAVKEGGVFSRQITEVEINVLPKDIPEYIEVNVAEMTMDDTIRLTDLKLPADCELVEFMNLEADEIEEHNLQVCHYVIPRVEVEPEEGEEVDAGEVPATEQADDADAGGEEKSDD